MNGSKSNPFEALIRDTNGDRQQPFVPKQDQQQQTTSSAYDCFFANCVKYVFLINAGKCSYSSCQCDGHKSSQYTNLRVKVNGLIEDDVDITVDNLDAYIFDRLMSEPDSLRTNVTYAQVWIHKDCLNKGRSPCKDEDVELRQLQYLYKCYQRLQDIYACEADGRLSHMKKLIETSLVNQTASFLSHADIYPGNSQNVPLLLNLMEDYYNDGHFGEMDILKKFVGLVADKIDARFKAGEDDVSLVSVLRSAYYTELCKKLEKTSLMDPRLSYNLSIIQCLTSSVSLITAFLELNSPWLWEDSKRQPPLLGIFRNFTKSMGDRIQDTVIGRILSISSLPRQSQHQFEFFLTPSRYSAQEHAITEKNLAMQLESITKEMYQLFLTILRHQETRNCMLNWLGHCLDAFKERSKMWNNQMAMYGMGSNIQFSDGFMLNLSAVLLRLCQPFCSSPKSPKLLKIDCRYPKSKAYPLDNGPQLGHSSGVYIRGLNDETCLIQPSSGAAGNSLEEVQYNFMTEIFFATHKSLHLGFRVCHERFVRMTSDLNRLQHIYEDARSQSAPSGSDTVEMLQERMDKGMTKFLSLKALLNVPDRVELIIQFQLATTSWLNNLAMAPTEIDAMAKYHDIRATIGDEEIDIDGNDLPGPKCLESVPEFIVENISDVITYVRRFCPEILLQPNINLDSLMSLITIFMGSPSKMKNPHLRARLAELLEALIPHKNTNPSYQYGFASSIDVGGKLFTENPQLIATLLHVFISIEMTGQSVAFEQKFQYRRPMYIVLEYLWSIKPHRERMAELAIDAETKIESANAPLFLRFINLLMNDATWLLDEGLNYMSQIREMQKERSSGQWNGLSQQERQQKENSLTHLGQLARFHNVIGGETIHTLNWLTEDIKTIFCHPTLIDRMASMLNYFLHTLVGPKKKNFKVKDLDEFEFKPDYVVNEICMIYLNLGMKANRRVKEFCLSVAGDFRSYSKDLLPEASAVLLRTGKGAAVATEVDQLAERIERIWQQHKFESDDIDASDVPDEFLDPIMSTLMTDPVVLPSGYILDRNTIARHLLSDQSDPFTRAPLTMNMVIEATELKKKIAAFIVDIRRNGKAKRLAETKSN